MSSALADKLEIWGYQDDFILFGDGSLGFALDAVPIDISCWEADRVNDYAKKISHFLNGLPSGIDIQFVQEIQSGNESLISEHEKLSQSAKDEIVKEICQRRVERLNSLDGEGVLPRHALKILVRKAPLQSLVPRPILLSRPKLFQEMAESKLVQELGVAKQLRTELLDSLKTLEIDAKVLSQDAISDLLYEQWNPTRGIQRGGYDPDNIRSSLLFTDAQISQTGFSLGEMHYRVLSLKLLPDETFAGMARVLRELPFDTHLFLTIRVPDQQKELESLQAQRRIAFSMARGKQSGVSDIDSEAKLQDLETLLEEMIASGEKVFHVSLNVLLRSPHLDELNAQVPMVLMKLREMNGAEGMTETLAAFDIFSEFAIPNARAHQRAKRMKTSNLTDLLPLYGPWPGHSKPSILLRSRMGSLVSFDPFSPDLSNYNHIVSGGSGSGKSFLTNILLLQMLKENPLVFVVDIGGSYKKLCENLSGQYIPLGMDSKLSINPFDLGAEESVPSNSKIKFLLGLVELMTKEEGDKGLPRYERAEIEQAIQVAYEKSKSPKLTTLREVLLKHEDSTIRRFGQILTPWCGETPYGKFVDQATNISLEKPVVSFDLKGMETYPDLQAVALFIITDFVWRESQRNRGTKKFLVLDECWKLLENEAGSTFIAEVFRTFRKYFAGAIAISQNVDDFAKSKVADAILTNSSMKWILKQRGADQARLKEVLQLNEMEMDLIASLSQERGLYSEVFLMAEGNHTVASVEPTALEYWIATTDPRDLGAIEETEKSHPNAMKLTVLKILAEKFPRGAASSILGKPTGNLWCSPYFGSSSSSSGSSGVVWSNSISAR